MATYTNPGLIRYETAIFQARDVPNSSAFVEFPYSVEELFGVRGRVPVRASFDGVAYSGSLAKIGDGNHLLLIRKEIREALGKQDGDTVSVVIELDETPREVQTPADLAAALAGDTIAERNWDALAYSHRREYVRWIDEAKRDETRRQRVARCVERVGQGVKAPR